MMIPGDIVDVRDKDGNVYEAVIRGHQGGNLWHFEWISGPNDMVQDVALFDQDEADNWKVQ